MKAFILAAGLGTRLRPFTLEHPKALVPVGGVPMLERVMLRLRDEGFDEVVVNVHHFAGQIEDFLKANSNFGMRVSVSDERDRLLDTGGAILHALPMMSRDERPFLVHNVDILSNAPLAELMNRHMREGGMATLLVSQRDSSRRLCFGTDMQLRGWHNVKDEVYRPATYLPSAGDHEFAFSGIHVLSPAGVRSEMERQRRSGSFSVIDFYMDSIGCTKVMGHFDGRLDLIDIGKPDTLSRAESLFADQR